MSKKKELTQEEKVTKRKERRNSFFKSALFSFATSASTVFELGLNERTYGIMSDTTDNRQDTNTKTL